jgi:hypothetical protein
LQSGLTQRDMWVMHSPAGAGGGGGVSQITAGHAARTRCWFRLRQVGVGACHRTLPATAPACYAHHWERAPPARQQCLAPLHQIVTAGTILPRRLPPPAGAGGGGGVSQNIAGHSTSVLRSPLGAHASGAPTVSRTPASDRDSGNRPVPQTPAPSGDGWGWGRVTEHCRPQHQRATLTTGSARLRRANSASRPCTRSQQREPSCPADSRPQRGRVGLGACRKSLPDTQLVHAAGFDCDKLGWGRIAEHCRPQHQRATLTTGSARLRRTNSVSRPCTRSR